MFWQVSIYNGPQRVVTSGYYEINVIHVEKSVLKLSHPSDCMIALGVQIISEGASWEMGKNIDRTEIAKIGFDCPFQGH